MLAERKEFRIEDEYPQVARTLYLISFLASRGCDGGSHISFILLVRLLHIRIVDGNQGRTRLHEYA